MVLPTKQSRTRIQEEGVRVERRGTASPGGPELVPKWMAAVPPHRANPLSSHQQSLNAGIPLGCPKVSDVTPLAVSAMQFWCLWVGELHLCSFEDGTPAGWSGGSNRHMQPTGSGSIYLECFASMERN